MGGDGAAANGELERYLPSNVQVHDGSLDIVAKEEPYTYLDKSYQYTSGMMTTDSNGAIKYGYIEARVRMDQGKGIWPAFWLLPADHSSTNELDIAEILCDHTDVVNTALHFISSGTDQSTGEIYHGASLSDDFHILAIDWEPSSITWFEDGKPFAQVTDLSHIPQKPMYLIFNTAIGGYWSGNPDTSTTFPHHFQVDWVQVWQHAGNT